MTIRVSVVSVLFAFSDSYRSGCGSFALGASPIDPVLVVSTLLASL
jgi:hypothetical protein